MKYESAAPFESIESAQEYLGLLAQVVLESQQAAEADLRAQTGSAPPRRIEALRMIAYNLEKLALHLRRSHRILNDLRTLRRLLHQERSKVAA